ncbi:HDOD domain-containing protein [candidate division KSB1 bacterium]|nr:HDOD domain-containing protein [candidate division KSB1 bacterium]
MEKKRVIFVDEDAVSLRSLRRMLIQMPEQWEFGFAESSESALDILQKETYDVIVADIRMPKMDGVQLLSQIKENYPGMVRMILSGHSNRELIIQSTGPCHQFLSKPTSSEKLISTIHKAVALRDLLEDTTLQNAIAQLEGIPSIPQIYLDLNAEIKSANASLKKIGQIVSRDIGMSAKILQLVNSAFFGLPRHIASVEQAVRLLGMEIISALVLSTKIFSLFQSPKTGNFSLEWLTNHNFLVANYAKNIANAHGCDSTLCEQSFLSGLLHDIGKLIFYTIHQQKYDEILATITTSNMHIFELEEQSFGSSHASIGAYLLGLWGLPDTVVEALAFHHKPALSMDIEFTPLTAVHIANVFYYELNANSGSGKIPSLDRHYLDTLGISEQITAWREKCQITTGAEAEQAS